MTGPFVESYAWGKLNDLVFELMTHTGTARERLTDNLHYFAIISPSDFRSEKHQAAWKKLHAMSKKTKNVGLVRAPYDQLTVQNKTLQQALTTIWDIYQDCERDMRPGTQ